MYICIYELVVHGVVARAPCYFLRFLVSSDKAEKIYNFKKITLQLEKL